MDICKLRSEKKRPMKTLSTYLEVIERCRDAVFLGCFRLPSQLLYPPQELRFYFLWPWPQTELRIISVPIEQDRGQCDAASMGLTLLWTQGRSCSFYALFAQHRIDFLSHVMLSGGAIKEQKSKPKKNFPSAVWCLFYAQKKRNKSRNKTKHHQAFREKLEEKFPKGKTPLENIWLAVCIWRDKSNVSIAFFFLMT